MKNASTKTVLKPASRLKVLFVDDERSLQEIMGTELPRLGHEVTVCPDGKSALKAMEKSTFDAAILDLRMPGMSGIEVLEHLKKVSPDTEAVVMTGHASMETAIEAVRLGAFDYITKPCKLAELETVLIKIAEKRELMNRNLALQSRVQAAEGNPMLVGKSASMIGVQRLIATVAPADSTVLILGETGTGKEMAARAIWQQSKRADMSFLPVNCGALSENLVESELFGHKRGSFTGADRDHKGLFEVANGGTLFLDEIGELNKNIQVKLLRFLESGEIRRVGESEPFRTDVRVLCATNRDLRLLIKTDQFREDLYFRVNTFEIRLPPLRERRPDIPELARHLLARAMRKPLQQAMEMIAPEAVDVLLEHSWPGNVRELANVMEYGNIIAAGEVIKPEHLPSHIKDASGGVPSLSMVAGSNPVPRTLEQIEMEHLLRVLDKHGGNKAIAAAELDISLKTLYNKLNRLQEQRRLAG
ncbi:MAG: sigma-54-dependent Fis family transcriptional regulator [Gemmataceae bacterium]|nr:sigma-54-dependent Fis family transcriptional regulator [Gemmataceae bacterium]